MYTLSEKKHREHVTDKSFLYGDYQPRINHIVARCLCNTGWTGDKCSYPVMLNGWTPWSPWSSCEPACQSSIVQLPPNVPPLEAAGDQWKQFWGLRQRSRYRECIGKNSDCYQQIVNEDSQLGISQAPRAPWRTYEYRVCRPRPCDRHLHLARESQPLKRSSIIKQAVRCRVIIESKYWVNPFSHL